MALQYLSLMMALVLTSLPGRATPFHDRKEWKNFGWMAFAAMFIVMFDAPGWYYIGFVSIIIWAATAWELGVGTWPDPRKAWLFAPPMVFFTYRAAYLSAFSSPWYLAELALSVTLAFFFIRTLRRGHPRPFARVVGFTLLFYALVFLEEAFSYELIFNVFYGDWSGASLLSTVNYSVSLWAATLSVIAAVGLFFKGVFNLAKNKKPKAEESPFSFAGWKSLVVATTVTLALAALHYLSPVVQPWALDALLVGYPLFFTVWLLATRGPGKKSTSPAKEVP